MVRTARTPPRCGDPQLRHEPVHRSELAGVERVEAFRPEPLLVARGDGHGDLGRIRTGILAIRRVGQRIRCGDAARIGAARIGVAPIRLARGSAG